MKSLKDIEESVKNFKVRPRPRMHRKVLDEALAIQQSQDLRHTSGTTLWRSIMKSRKTQFTAVALILITAILGVNIIGGPDMATVALAEVRQSLDRVEYLSTEHYDDKGQYRSTSWSGLGFYCNKSVDGRCVYVTNKPNRKKEYDPKAGVITVSWPGVGYSIVRKTPLQTIKRRLDHHKEYAKKIDTNRGKLNGQDVDVIKIYGTKEDADEVFTIWCDLLSHLPLKVNRRDNSTIYSYPEEIPTDIYALGAPQSAKVISTVPHKDVQELLSKFFKWRKSALKYKNMENMFGYLTPTRTGRIVENEYAQEHGLICLEEFVQGTATSPRSDLQPEIRSFPSRRLHFFDPKRSFMWVRREEFVVPKANWQIDKNWLPEDRRNFKPSHRIFDILQCNRGEDGVWYPVKVSEFYEARNLMIESK